MADPDFTYAPRLEITDPNAEAFYGQLLRGTTHKLNNLLAVIHGFSSLIMMNDTLEASEVENLTHMKDAAQNASLLSERILTAGGCTKVSSQEVSTDEFITGLDSTVRERFSDKDIPFEIKSSSGLPNLMSDASRLKDVIVELLDNAVDAASETGGSASIEFRPGTDGRVEIVVENTGPTIADMAQIYEPFYTTKDSNHFGIGLTSVAVLCGQLDIPLCGTSADGKTTFVMSVGAV